MPTYISHIYWTGQGIRSVNEAPKRLDAVKKQLKTLGGELKAFYMTQGTYDALLIFEVPNDTVLVFFFQAEDGIRDLTVTGVQTCALPISPAGSPVSPGRQQGP